jgi:alpha-ketoglutarate-dependent taurine dioxygenase
MKVSKIPGCGNYGIFIDDVDFDHLTDEEWIEIGKLHLDNFVTIIRNTNLNHASMIHWIEKFGTNRYNVWHDFVKKYNVTFGECVKMAMSNSQEMEVKDRELLQTLARMQEITNDGKFVMRVSGRRDENGNPLGMFAEGELLWHSNESGNITFTPGVALLGAENVVGSSTGFVTTVDYYENVSESFRSELDDMIVVHQFTPGRINPGLRYDQDNIMNANMCPEDGVEIPMVITSPGGHRGLHYSVNTISHIQGMSVEESRKVFDKIDKELFVDKYIYDHWYKNNGDLLLFDNSITLHRRLGDIKDRLCYRVQHDYSNCQEGFWQPYDQPEIAKAYRDEITHYVEALGITDFKL